MWYLNLTVYKQVQRRRVRPTVAVVAPRVNICHTGKCDLEFSVGSHILCDPVIWGEGQGRGVPAEVSLVGGGGALCVLEVTLKCDDFWVIMI